MTPSVRANSSIDPPLDRSVSILRAAYAAIPSVEDMEQLISDGERAAARGYYDPIEEERLRQAYVRYLAIRVSLWDLIQESRPAVKRVQRSPSDANLKDICVFGYALCAADIIVRSGEYLINLARGRKLVWTKLDEPEARYGIRRKSFTRLYRQLTSAVKMHGFYRACSIFDENKEKILNAVQGDVQKILTELNLPTASRGDHIKRYRQFLRHSFKRRGRSARKNILFSLFEVMGSDIADLKIPLVKPPNAPKRVTSSVIKETRSLLEPGDVFVTRHDDAMSNLFLPGFWPHSALWLGDGEADILEAKKDGVLIRPLEETLAVDAFTVIRPILPIADINAALAKARTHQGKLYDFVFDFRTSDKLVCTEVIYRTYHGIGDVQFDLKMQAGRYCLSAEELLNQGLSLGWFEVVATYGVVGDRLHTGKEALMVLRNSFKSRF